MKQTSVYLEDGQHQVVKQIANESTKREDVPDLSFSEVMRELLADALEERPDLKELVGEGTMIKYQKERFLGDEGYARNQRTGFETQVKRHFKNRFENGVRPEQLEEWAENMRQQAYILWPPQEDDSYHERREEALEYVDAILEESKKATAATSYDPLDPSQVFAGYEGVEDGKAREEAEDLEGTLVGEAEKRLRGAVAADPNAIADSLSKKYGVPEELAEEAVQEAINKIQGGE